jgi:hypothetical protein
MRQEMSTTKGNAMNIRFLKSIFLISLVCLCGCSRTLFLEMGEDALDKESDIDLNVKVVAPK